MAGAAIPTSLLLLLLLWMCCSFASATRGIDGGKDGGCEVLTDKISGAQFVLDTHALQSANGDVQRILDCLPEGSKVLIDVEDLPLSKDLVIRKPVAIHSRRRRVRTKVSGGVIKVRADNTEVKGLTIVNYVTSSKEGFIDIESANGVVIEEVECFGCSNSDGPSCISGTRSSVTIRKMSAKNNSGVEGGAMRFTDSTIVIRDSLFEENSSSKNGGALYLGSCDLEMENTVFTGNSAADDGSGGGVYAEGSSWTSKTAFVRNCSFIGNHAGAHGGGLDYRLQSRRISGSSIEIVDTDVRDNSAGSSCGGMYIYMGSTTNPVVRVQSSRITGNTAGGDGGGLYISMHHSTNGIIQIINSYIVGNSATSSYGGGVYFGAAKANNCTTEVIGTQIANNTALTHGGGAFFHFKSATKSHIRIYTSNIDGNTAPKGGAGMHFRVQDSKATKVRLLLSSFTNNSGDALYYYDSGATDFDKDDYECIIPNNSDYQASDNPFVNKPSSNPTYVL